MFRGARRVGLWWNRDRVVEKGVGGMRLRRPCWIMGLGG